MVEEKDIVEFLKDHKGQASLDQISEGLEVPKYGPTSAYASLQSLRSKGIVDRKGEMWVLVVLEMKSEALPEVEKVMKAMAKTLAEAMKGAREPADEWELATKPMKTEIERKEKKLSTFVLRPDVATEAKKPLIGLPTGTFIDPRGW